LTAGDGEDDTDWEIADEEVAVSIELEREDVHVVFWEGFRRLTARDREILTLRHFQELAYREIAHALEIPEGTVMSRLFHARRKLRDLLSPHLDNALQDYSPPDRSGREGRGDQP